MLGFSLLTSLIVGIPEFSAGISIAPSLVDSGSQVINVKHPLYGAFGDVQIIFDGQTDGSTANLSANTSQPFGGALTGMTVIVGAPSSSGARNDGTGGTGAVTVTSGSAVILDNQAVNADLGKAIIGAGIPAGAWVIDRTAGTSLTINTPATGNGTACTVSAILNTTITGVSTNSLITLATGVANRADGVGLTGLTVQFGHDDTAALQAAVNAAGKTLFTLPAALPNLATEILLPTGMYFVNASSILAPQTSSGGFYQWRNGTIIWRGMGMDSTALIQLGPNGIFRPGSRTLSITTLVNSTAATGGSAAVPPLATDVDAGLSGNSMSTTQIAAVSGNSITLSNPANASATANYTVQTRVPRFEWRDMTLFGNQLGTVDRLNRPIGCFPRSSGSGTVQSVPAPYQTQVEQHYPYQLGGTAAARNDTGITLNATTTTYVDVAITSLDIGSTVTNANIPANTTITAIDKITNTVTISNATTNGAQVVNQTVAVQPYGTSTGNSATTLTDANAAWAVNQWVGALVFIDEDKATDGISVAQAGSGQGVGVGSGYGWVQSNTATVLTVIAWIPTRGSNAYVPSGANVRYRLHLQATKPTTPPHKFERVRFLGPRGFCVTSLVPVMQFTGCIFDQCGQPAENPPHNDTLSSTGGYFQAEGCQFLGGRGSYCDMTGTIAGMFPRLLMNGCHSVNRNVANLLACGIGSLITSNTLESQPGSGSIGYDATVIEPNKGNNLVSANSLPNMSVLNGGLSSTRNDRVNNNLATDGPLGVAPATFANFVSAPPIPATTVPIRNSFACDCTVVITAGIGNVTVAIGGTTVKTIGAATTDEVRLPSTLSITLTYASGNPTWIWVGD